MKGNPLATQKKIKEKKKDQYQFQLSDYWQVRTREPN